VVSGGRVYLQSASDDASKRLLVSIDAVTGQQLWVRESPGGPGRTSKQHPKSSLAAATPAADAQRVYAAVWDGDGVAVRAYSHAGDELWQTPLGPFESEHGPAASPVPFGGKVFVNHDQDGAAELVALNASTGAKVWSTPRKPHRSCPTTPVVRELPGGRAEVVISSTTGVGGYDPDTGRANWVWEAKWPEGAKNLRAVASPVIAAGVVVAGCGEGSTSGRRAFGLDPARPVPLLWETKRDTSYVPTPVTKGEHVYWIRDDGFAVCAEARTGRTIWAERLTAKAVSSSPILVGDTVLVFAEDGRAVAFKADPGGLELVGGGSVPEAVFATPAAIGGRLYVRGASHLYAIGPARGSE
jgi:hypothetical protein